MSQTKAELIQTVKQGTVSLGDADSSHSIKLKAPATVAADRTWTMPAVDPTANQVLRGNSGTPTTLEWGTISSGGATRDATGTRNIAGPTTAGDALEAGAQDNTLYGYDAGTALTTGDNNLAVGAYSLIGATTSSQNTALGSNCMTGAVSGADNVATGFFALKDTTSGANNVAVGRSALQDHTDGDANIAVGRSALENMAAGDNNVAIGKDAGLNATNISKAILIGYEAGKDLADGTNIAIGDRALSIATGVAARSNIAIGYRAMTDIAGYSNIGIGGDCCGGGATASGTGAHYNVALGDNALEDLTDGDGNVAIGVASSANINSGSNNVCMGYAAGTAITSGNQNTCLGKEAGYSLTTGSHAICVGYRAGKDQITTTGDSLWIANGPFSAGNDNCFIYGNSLGELIQGSNSSSWYTTSDSRLKKNIVDNNVGLSVIDNITVRNFEYRTEAEIDRADFPKVSTDKYTKEEADEYDDIAEGDYKQGLALIHPGTQLGVIAQELESVAPNCVKTDSRDVKTVSTDDLFWHMINSIKELSAEVKTLKTKVATLEAA